MTDAFLPPQDLDIPTYQQHRASGIAHTLLDVRETWEFEMGHIPGAVNIPLSELPERLDEVAPDQPVVVVCAHGIRSVYAAQFLSRSGHSGVYNLLGGTAEWIDRALPVET